MFKTLLTAFILCLAIISCTSKRDTGSYDYGDPKSVDGYTQTGLASWYGDKEHKNKTASGERFSRYAYTAAHKTLPFGTVVRVTNLENGRDVVVKINDRGPFIRGRIIDLSYASAGSIDLVRTGTAKVKVEVISSPSSRNDNFFKPIYTVQVGSFSSKVNASSVKNDLNSEISNDIRIEPVKIKGYTYYRVRVGMFSSKSKAESLKRKLRNYGYRGKVILE
ncbi:MAG: septal ring lytic transglycosylase RlpA family protein [Thermodesulfobacteriota bacterium]